MRRARSVFGSASVRDPRWRVWWIVSSAPFEVEVGPSQPEELALPHAGAERRDIERLEAVARDAG